MAIGLNGNGKSWLDRWMWEIIRLTTVAVIALGGAYWAITSHIDARTNEIEDQHNQILREAHRHCLADAAVRQNQRLVLVSMLALIDVLDDRWKAGLRRVPPQMRNSVLIALSNLPDKEEC